MASLLISLALLITPASFDVDELIDALAEEDISAVSQDEVSTRAGADECTAVVTARSARFVACTHPTTADARTVAYRRSDYERTTFQRGPVIVYLRDGASLRLRDAVDTVMEEG